MDGFSLVRASVAFLHHAARQHPLEYVGHFATAPSASRILIVRYLLARSLQALRLTSTESSR